MVDVVEVDLATGEETVRKLTAKEEAAFKKDQESRQVDQEDSVSPTVEERLAALEAKVL